MQQVSNNFGSEIILLSEEEYDDLIEASKDNLTEEQVVISATEYASLLDDACWRTAYENAGVDNWGGADFARELYREYSAEEN